MSINMFNGSRLTLQSRSLILESHQYIQTAFSDLTTRPIELKFHMKTPYDRLAKIYTH